MASSQTSRAAEQRSQSSDMMLKLSPTRPAIAATAAVILGQATVTPALPVYLKAGLEEAHHLPRWNWNGMIMGTQLAALVLAAGRMGLKLALLCKGAFFMLSAVPQFGDVGAPKLLLTRIGAGDSSLGDTAGDTAERPRAPSMCRPGPKLNSTPATRPNIAELDSVSAKGNGAPRPMRFEPAERPGSQLLARPAGSSRCMASPVQAGLREAESDVKERLTRGDSAKAWWSCAHCASCSRCRSAKSEHAEQLEWMTPLISACIDGRVACVQALLQSPEADLDFVDVDGHTALHAACAFGYVDCVRMLIAAGASLSLRDHEGSTALDGARMAETDAGEACASMMMEAGAREGNAQVLDVESTRPPKPCTQSTTCTSTNDDHA